MRINNKDQKLEMEERDWNYIMPAYLRSYLFYTKNIPPAEVVFPMFKAVKYGEMMIPVRWVEPDSKEAMEVQADASNVPEATEAEIAQKDAEEKPPIAEQVEEIAKEVSAARAAFSVVEEPPTEAEAAEIQANIEADAALSDAIDKAEEAATEEPTTDAVVILEEPTTPPPPTTPITATPEATPQPPQPTAQPTEPGTNDKPPATDRKPKLPPVVIPPGQPLDGMHPRDKADQKRVAKDLIPEPEIDEAREIEQDVEGLKE